MWQRRRCAQQDQRPAVQTYLRKTAFHQLADFLLRHSFFQRSEHCTKHIEGRLASQPHQLQLVRRLPPAARDGHRIGRNAFQSRRCAPQMIEKSKRRRFLHADASRSNPPVGQRRRRDFRRAFIFLPRAHFRGELQFLPHSSFFECRHNYDRIARTRQHQCQQSLADPPADSREVVQRRPWSKKQGVVFRRSLGH